MEWSELSDYLVPVILGICLCVGYLLKHLLPRFQDRCIPPAVALTGLAVAVWMDWPAITPETVLTGLVSGLASTGLHQTVHQLRRPAP